jgi:hypothetical protein
LTQDSRELTENRYPASHDLEPTLQDCSTDEYTDEEMQGNLVVNLEDLVNEEYYINHISQALHSKGKVQQFCQNWWRVTEKSSVKEMHVFFEEEQSKKLIKTQQILLCVFIGYLELCEDTLYETDKKWKSLLNIINNLQRSYLVFIQFITSNLTEDQYDAACDWAGKLCKVLETRKVMKTH